MELKMTTEVQEKITNAIPDGYAILLDMDDGVGPYSKAGYCSLGISFRILAVKEPVQPPYTKQVDSPLGPVYVKDYTTDYFDGNPALKLNGNTIALSNDSGLVDGNVNVIEIKE